MDVGTSPEAGVPDTASLVPASDFVLLRGYGPEGPERFRKMIRASRGVTTWRPLPVLINEDDRFRLTEPDERLMAALPEQVSWGYFLTTLKEMGATADAVIAELP